MQHLRELPELVRCAARGPSYGQAETRRLRIVHRVVDHWAGRRRTPDSGCPRLQGQRFHRNRQRWPRPAKTSWSTFRHSLMQENVARSDQSEPPRFLRRWRRRRCRHRWWRMVHPARVCHAFRPSIRTWRSWTRWDHAAVMRAASTRPDGRCTVTDRSAMHGEARWAQTAKPDLQHLPIRVCAPASRARRGLSPRSAHRQGRISLPSGSRSWRKVQRTSMAAQAATPSPGFTFLLFDPLTSRADQEGANWRAASRKR
jgi:hypothetical protein